MPQKIAVLGTGANGAGIGANLAAAGLDVTFIEQWPANVEAYDTRWARELIKPYLKPDGLVVGLQNGMTVDVMSEIMGPERTLGAVIEIAAAMFRPGIVETSCSPRH
jgi:2-dehydropantoate 2-reductase